MRRVAALLAAVGAMLVLYAGGVLAQEAPGGSASGAERYIVVLNDNASGPGQVANEHARAHGASVGFVYRHAIKGYSAAIPENRIDDIENDHRVAYVEPDGTAYAVAQTLPWGINKIDADTSST